MKKLVIILAVAVVIAAFLAVFFVNKAVAPEVLPESTDTATEQQAEVEEPDDEDEVEIDQDEVDVEAQSNNLSRAVCDHDRICFADAVENSREAYYWGEFSFSTAPGISLWAAENWTFEPGSNGMYTFTTVSESLTPVFADDWWELQLDAGLIPQEVVDEIENAKWPTQAELDEMDSDQREYFETAMASGMTAKEAAAEQAKYSMESYIRSSLAGAYMDSENISQVCTSSNVNALVEKIYEWEKGNYSSSDLDFANCQTK